MNGSADIGFYGKVRTHGDFVGRGLPQAFVECWDDWVQRGMLAAHERLGDAWLTSYLVMPLWCFVLEGGVIDEHGYAGVMLPGLDAVGRYFPFVMATRIAPDAAAQWRVGGVEWYREVAGLALSTLDDDFSLSRLETQIKAVRDGWSEARRFELRSEIESDWWTLPDDPAMPPVQSDRLDNPLFMKLLGQ